MLNIDTREAAAPLDTVTVSALNNDVRGQRFERSFTIEPSAKAIDEDARTLELAFSSEEPYERFFGVEILDHKPSSARMNRLSDGAALLLQHDSDRHIGTVERASIDADRRGRAVVRFGRGPLAEEIWQDVRDGIRRHVSVGYIVHDMALEARSEDADTYRVTDWEPLEISIVSIPADATVGVGRNGDHQRHKARHTQEEDQMPDDIRDDVLDDERNQQARDAEDIGSDASDDNPSERSAERVATDARMRAIGARFRAGDLAEQFIELDGSPEELQAALRDRLRSAVARPAPAARDVRIEAPRYRTKALKAFAQQGEEAAYRSGMWALAMVHGNERAIRWCRDHGVLTRVASSSSISAGGAVVPEEMSSAIIDLREARGVARRLCDIKTMNSDTLTIPRRTGGVTAYFVGQHDATTESDKSWDEVQLVAKEVSALSRVPMSYAEDAAIDVAEDLAREMAYAFADKEDECLINGDGTSTYGGIVGLRSKLVDGSHTAGAVDATSGTNLITEVDGDDLDTLRATLPEYAGNPRWLVSKAFKNRVHDSITRAAGGNTLETLGGAPRPAYLGDEIVVSQVMPKALATDYENVVMALYGDFELGVTLGDRRGFTVQVLRERYAEYRQLGIIAYQRFDIVAHDLGDTSNAGPIVGLVGN